MHSASGGIKNTGSMDINDITYAINSAVFEVNRILGPGFLEAEIKRMVLNLRAPSRWDESPVGKGHDSE